MFTYKPTSSEFPWIMQTRVDNHINIFVEMSKQALENIRCSVEWNESAHNSILVTTGNEQNIPPKNQSDNSVRWNTAYKVR